MARRPFTEEDKRIIEKYYPIKTPAEVAAMLGRSVGVIRYYASKNNISNNVYWTEEEENYLEEKFGIMTIEGIAKKLGRSKKSVESKIKRSDIGNLVSNVDGLCISEVARLVGRDRTGITTTWIRRYGLKTYKKGKYKVIKEKDLINFMKNNPERWDATQCQAYFFERFDWFREKRLTDRNKMCERRWG